MYYLTVRDELLDNEISDFEYESLPHHKKLKYRKHYEGDALVPNSSPVTDFDTPTILDDTPAQQSDFNGFGGGNFGGGGADSSWDSGSSDSGSSSDSGGGDSGGGGGE